MHKKMVFMALLAGLCIAAFGQTTEQAFKMGTKATASTITKYTGKETAVVIPAVIGKVKVTVIGKQSFYDTKLTSITIPEGVTAIEEWAFGLCAGLTTVTIPASVTTIGKNAFARCAGLTTVTIPASVKTVGDGVFADCTKLDPAVKADIEKRFGAKVFTQAK
ncbi:MAG: leucine-rich repeat domain-containing protein [Treponema sp.]|nr:leucine-rich repeat domain-containing protein [Treponema sp.]